MRLRVSSSLTWLSLHSRLCDRQVHYLAYLPTSGVVAWTELQAACPAGVPGDDAVRVCGLYMRVERVGIRHVPECGGGRRVEGPALCQHHDLTQLPPGDIVLGAELQATC